MRAPPLLNLIPLAVLLPCLVGWNGSGPAVLDIQRDKQGAETYRSEAVCAGHPDRLEVVVVVTLPGEGDAVLSLRVPRALHNRPLSLPNREVRARYHEYRGDGSVAFNGRGVLDGHLRVEGNPRGALRFDLEITFSDGETERLVMGDGRLIAIDWEPVSGTDRGREVDDATPEGYYEGGCYGTYYESDGYDEDSYYAEDDYGDSGSGCGDDDLDDDGPSGSSGGCDSDADDDGYDDYGDDSDAGGCEGDDVDDSDDSWDDDDSGGGCEGDNVDALIASCARGPGGPGGPWMGRLVRWLPWFCVFFAIRLMRRRRRPGVLSGRTSLPVGTR